MSVFCLENRGDLALIRCSALHTPHAFTTRLGGVGKGDLSALNIGRGRGDSPETLAENYRRLGAAVGFDTNAMALSKQVHGRTVRIVREGFSLADQPETECDALTTNIPGIALIIYGADCVPVIIFDPVKQCIGAAHAGWRGTANGVVNALIDTMRTEYGARPGDMVAAIGPAIAFSCYETGAAEAEALSGAIGDDRGLIKPGGEGKYYADLKGLNALRLERAGLKEIYQSARCTHCEERLFWSHRRDGTKRGLQGAVIVLE